MSRHLKGNPLRLSHAITGALVFTWLFIGYDIYQRLSAKEPAIAAMAVANGPMADLFQAYGSTNECGALIDGSKLAPWREKYEAVLICGINQPPTDRYLAATITVSKRFAIRSEPINMSAPFSEPMTEALNRWAKELIANAVPAKPPLTTVANIPVWYELALFPTGTDLSEIHTIADIEPHHGKLITQEFPECTTCRPTFTVTWLPQSMRSAAKTKHN